MTREEELIRIAKKLDKMVSRNNTEGALDLLNELKSFNMTLKLLQETRIGMSVNGIRKHCTDDEVVSLAKILIKDWKRLLDAARTQSTERPNKMKNGVDSNKSTGSPVRSPLEKDTRRDSSDTLSPSHPRPTPPSRRPSVKVKKERKEPPRISVVRKEPPDPNAPFAPLPLHLHPPPHVKRPSVEVKKEREESSDYKPVSLKVTSSDHVKKDRKDSDSKVPKKTSVDAKKERKDLSDSKPKPAKRQSLDSSDSNPKRSKRQSLDSSDSNPKRSKRQSLDGKKDRKDSTDSKPSHSVKRHSTDSKSDRRDSVDSKTSNSPSAKKLSSETKEFHSSKSSHPGPLQRKSSTDSIERRGKPEMPKIPTTPTSPMSPSFSSAGVPLSLCLATGETIRDKCIEMLAAALRTDDNFKEFGTNCDSMAAEIEDHIYTEMGSTDMKYKNRVRSRISNLKDPKNPGLRRNVLAGGIELRRFAIMSAEEMASDELKQLRNNLTKEAIREHQLSKTSGTISDLFQCSKCGKKNCTYNQMQTRSADEPMTTFVLCNECGNRWKFC
ncbi:transcription elongation factor A protein 3-like isoform X12 [Oncorhynchus kisutch]|uniref:transcription elongation factor A protein 3-like isoform X12 n=1 Tax=Oncorhynchus kisutch TaxID=8019 RepID=UPI0012DECDC2|nr:transcription elongation factor A protein 3-like isoform X12 [Oncorhynchus kisutch]